MTRRMRLSGRAGPGRRRFRAVVIGASAGGFEALRGLLKNFSERFRPPIIVVLHVAATERSTLAEGFSRVSRLPVREAGERMRIAPGHVYVAPAGYHLLIEKDERFALSVDERVSYSRPSIDVLFESAAEVWRAGLAGVILTGANEDGAKGLLALRSHQGTAIVQDPDEAESPEMPRAALKVAGADHVLKLAEIAPLLNRLAGAEK